MHPARPRPAALVLVALLVIAAACSSSPGTVSPPGAPTPLVPSTSPPTTPGTSPATTARSTDTTTTSTDTTTSTAAPTSPPTTVAPTPAPTTVPPVVYLRAGDEGPEVSAIQRLLVDTGYLSPGYLDGVFDRSTNGAVLAFQGDYGLIVDGVVGPETRRSLRAAAASIAN